MFPPKGERCYDLELLILNSDAKGLCISTNDTVGNRITTLTHISIRLMVDDISHQYPTHCGKIGSSVLSDHCEFSCTLKNFDESEVEFRIKGKDFSIDDWWSATVRVIILRQCSEGIHCECIYNST